MYPPNGWGCGCDVEALSERELRALGKTGPDQAPDLGAYEDTDPRTGQPETRYPGIDRGWEYNVGQEWLSGVVPKELRRPLPPLDPSSQLAADLPDRLALVLGTEGQGLTAASVDACDLVVRIPMAGGVDSLNVAAAAAVAMYATRPRRRAESLGERG